MRLVAANLAYGFPGRSIGAGLDLAVRPGEVACVLGPNGGGKTTLLRTLVGLLPPLAGTVVLDGMPLAGIAARSRARAIAYVPQLQAPSFAFTVEDVVLMGRTAHLGPFGQPGRADRAAAEAAIERLGIQAIRSEAVTEISGGQRQLVAIARALAQDAPILVMDEPAAHLDFANQLLVLDEMRGLAARGLGILFTTHDPQHAFAFADHVLLLARGGAMAAGAPAETMTAPALSRLYGRALDVLQLPAPDGRRFCLPQRPQQQG